VLKEMSRLYGTLLSLGLLMTFGLPSNVNAQALVPKTVADPQAHMAAISQKCYRNMGSCIRDGFVLSFGPGAASIEGIDSILTMFSGTRAKHWVILSDTSYADTARWIFVLVVGEDETSLFFRGQFVKTDDVWKIVTLDIQTQAKDIFIPLPPGGVQVPITQRASRPK
jgi:hypothetical protein